MRKIVAITPADASPGFACSGAVQVAVAPGEAAGALTRVLADPECGLVVLDERLVAEVGEERISGIDRRWPGVLVVLPAPGVSGEEEDYAVRLIRKAIGYHVRVRT
jgi:V/A-type H+-transporting ATPase subunit F